jgi:hypothetical protein
MEAAGISKRPLFAMKCCAWNTGATSLFLDHIAPLASLLDMPLIVTHDENAALAKKFYPEVKVRYWPDLEFRLQELAEEFDTIFDCDFSSPSIKFLWSHLFQKEVRLIFCPHGQSDKGYGAPTLAPYIWQETVLLYGSLMKEMLVELHLWDSIKAHVQIGNYRLHYYRQHREHLMNMAQTEIFSALDPARRTLLYAPTWNDDDRSTTFFMVMEKIVKEIPDGWNLIVKIHPFLWENNAAFFSSLQEKGGRIIFVHDFPPIYPLLERADAYLGDYSSVGYDALAFRLPMFFIQKPSLPAARLHSCGQVLDLSGSLFESIERGLNDAPLFRSAQDALYQKAFVSDGVDIKEALAVL